MEEKETTVYRFCSEIRSFISKLIKNPISANVSSYLKERNLSKTKIIDELIKRDVLERHEKILDSTNSDKRKPTYSVTYKVSRKDFDKKLHRMYTKYFEKNLPEKKEKLNEEGEAAPVADTGNSNGGGILNQTDRGTYDTNALGSFSPVRQKKPSEVKPKNVRNIYMKESHIKYIKKMIDEATATTNIGDYQYDVPLAMKKSDPSMSRPKGGICCGNK